MKKISILLSLLFIISCSDSTKNSTNLPGRLGNPEMSLINDPNLAVTKVMSEYGLDALAPDPPISIDATQKEKVDYMTSLEPAYEEIFKSWYSDLPEVVGVERFTKVIDGVDGNKITLYIHKPEKQISTLPGILHIHGGGMSILKASNPNYVRWRDDLASTGLVVVGVEFRNVAGSF